MADPVVDFLKRRRAMLRAEGKRIRRRKTPRAAYPGGARLRYFRALKSQIEALDVLMWAEIDNYLADEERKTNKLLLATTLFWFVDRLLVDIGNVLRRAEVAVAVDRIATGIAADVALHNKQQIAKQFMAIFGVDMTEFSRPAPSYAEIFRRENVNVITGMLQSRMQDIDQIVTRGVRLNKPVVEIREEIQRRFGRDLSRAASIARDQVGNLNAALTKFRHTSAGITEYEWETMLDERVRPGHAALHGTRQRWDSPPIENPRTGERGHPSEPYACRCGAIPIAPEFVRDL